MSKYLNIFLFKAFQLKIEFCISLSSCMVFYHYRFLNRNKLFYVAENEGVGRRGAHETQALTFKYRQLSCFYVSFPKEYYFLSSIFENSSLKYNFVH